jgi:hypothetical protein
LASSGSSPPAAEGSRPRSCRGGVVEGPAAALRARGSRAVALDELRLDPLEFLGGECREQFPREVERLGDRAPLGVLPDEAPLELVDEGEDAAVVV